jgi:hypothetical protein
MALSEETREQGLAELRALADQGTFEANWLLGQLYSPLCPGEFPDTDAAAAFEWFSRARAIHEDPDSLYEMARLLYNGPPGVERDRARAQELYEKAKAARPDLPAIDFVAAVAQKPLEEEGWSNWWITGAVAGVVGVFAGALFWHLRRENK